MTSLPSLRTLLARVKAATGADRELDYAVLDAFRPTLDEWNASPVKDMYWAVGRNDYTASVDAALALVDRLLPGWGWQIHKDDEHFNGPIVYWAGVAELTYTPTVYRERGKTPALAVLASLLSALIARAEAQEVEHA